MKGSVTSYTKCCRTTPADVLPLMKPSSRCYPAGPREQQSAGWVAAVRSSGVDSCGGGAGELNFVVIGVVLQMLSMVTESTRLVLVQILLQVRFRLPTGRDLLAAPPNIACTQK